MTWGRYRSCTSGYQSVVVDAARQKMEAFWGVKDLPAAGGLTVTEMVEAAGDEVKNMYIVGENRMMSDPDLTHVAECLKKLEFLVVQDIFLTETAELADRRDHQARVGRKKRARLRAPKDA